MAIPLKYNTASQEVPLGYFLDSTDGDTEETGLTIANTDIKLWKSGATTLANKNSGGGTHISNGVYYATLDATDTNTYGPMVIFVHVSGALTVRLECLVMEANAYDALMAALGTGYMESNMLQISGDSGAADNLESTYNGTGYTDDNAPAKQSQLSNIANVGSAIHQAASSYVLTTGTQSANTYTSTEALDGTRHEHTDDTGAMELYYQFLIGAGTPSSVQITGYIFSANDDVDVYGYDWATTSWVQIGNLPGSSASNNVNSYDMFVNMVGTGSDAGKVRVRFYKASGLTSATLAIDQIFVAFSQGAVSALDAVYFDSNASNTGTTSIDGVPGNPVSSEAAINTLLAARNLYKVEVALESSLTFTTSHIDEIWAGIHWTLANGGQDQSGSHIVGADVSGTATASVDPIDYDHCDIGTCTLPQFHMRNCDFDGTVTFSEAGNYLISGSHSGIAGVTTPIFDTGAGIANVNFSLSDWQNGLEIRNLNNSGTDNFSISGTGQIIYAASCSGTVNQRGDWKVTNTGGVTITEDDNTANVAAILVDTGTTLPATLGSPAGADMSTDIAAVKAETALIVADTNELQTNQGNWLTATGFFASGTMTESYAADGAEFTPEQALYQIWQFLSEFSIAGTTVTVKKLDGSTTAMTFTLDDGTTPTAINRAT